MNGAHSYKILLTQLLVRCKDQHSLGEGQAILDLMQNSQCNTQYHLKYRIYRFLYFMRVYRT